MQNKELLTCDSVSYNDVKQYVVLIIYDITDNTRRNKLVKFLEGYGLRVQKSAFEAYISKKQYDALIEKAHTLINENEDSLRIYFLDSQLKVRSWGLGDNHIDEIIIF